MQYKLYTDGGARNNPGPAAVGGVLYHGQQKIDSFSEYIGEATNNQAEYQAILTGLQLAIQHKVDILDCFLDSKLVVEQLNGHFKIKEVTLQKLFVKVYNMTHKFKKITFHHIYRDKNKEADRLVNQALDKK